MYPARNSGSWPDAWQGVPSDQCASLEEELARELTCSHPLQGLRCRAIARRADQDDVLYALDEPGLRVALVHLTWSGRSESAGLPHTVIFGTFEEFMSMASVSDE